MISPYQNNAESMQIGQLIIENQTDKISIYGDIDIPQTQQGLADAKRLQALFDKIVRHLEAQAQDESQTLSSSQADTAKPKTVNNPFQK